MNRPLPQPEQSDSPPWPQPFFSVAAWTTLLHCCASAPSRLVVGESRVMAPPHHKFGRRVVYSRDDLLAWTQAQRRQSTSEPRAACTRKPPAKPPHSLALPCTP